MAKKTYTRGRILIERPKDEVFDVSLEACKVLRRGGFTSTGFTSSGFTTDTPAKMKARMSVFYADFDENNNYNSISTPLQVDRDLVEKAVEEFLKFIKAQKYP